MRRAAAIVALTLSVATCTGDPAAPLDAANAVVGQSTPNLKIVVRGRGEVKHTADLAGTTSCSTLSPNPERAECVRSYALNAGVSLQATAGPGFAFDHWGGSCKGAGACSVTMNEPRTVEAIFKAVVVTPTSYTLQILVRGRGEVRHSADLAGATSCSTLSPNPERADCVRTFAAGSEIVLQPEPAPGLKLLGWSGACGGKVACTLRANENRVLEVRFGS